MNTLFDRFKQLHQRPEPLLIGNVWNVQSARVFEKLKYQAIATSSAAVAETLGYPDGEQMPFDEYAFVIGRIAQSVALPLSVDLEAGYGESAHQIADHIRQLASIGICGINIEDSRVSNGKRNLVDAAVFAQKLKEICQSLQKTPTHVFINVRSDAFLLGQPSPVEEALRRVKIYDKTGVHGIFFPCVTKLDDIRQLVKSTHLPVNVMCMPDLPAFDQLQEAGVKRISMGNFLNTDVYKSLEKLAQEIVTKKSFSAVFDHTNLLDSQDGSN